MPVLLLIFRTVLAGVALCTLLSTAPHLLGPVLPSAQLAFIATREGNRGIYLYDADRRLIVTCIHTTTQEYNLAWSPNGKQLGFMSFHDGLTDLYVMDADGRNVRNLTHGNAGYLARGEPPVWSPDGRQIAFSASASSQAFSEIYVIPADGGVMRNVSQRPEAHNWSPRWSPDGSKLAFLSDVEGAFSIYVLDMSGAIRASVFPVPRSIGEFFWSADGQQIVVMRPHPGAENGDILAIHLADGSLHNVTSGQEVAWSPDGRQLAFQLHSGDRWDIHVISSECIRNTENCNHSRRNLTQSMDATTINYSPAWSPDGRQIAFSAQSIPNTVIYLVNVDGSNLRPILAIDNLMAADTSWSPDGRFLAIKANNWKGGTIDFSVFDLARNHLFRLTFNGSGNSLAWRP